MTILQAFKLEHCPLSVLMTVFILGMACGAALINYAAGRR